MIFLCILNTIYTWLTFECMDRKSSIDAQKQVYKNRKIMQQVILHYLQHFFTLLSIFIRSLPAFVFMDYKNIGNKKCNSWKRNLYMSLFRKVFLLANIFEGKREIVAWSSQKLLRISGRARKIRLGSVTFSFT